MKKKQKKKNNYTKQKYPALNVKYQVGNRRELIDYDYIDKLSPEEKDWLDRFTSEYVITNFQHRGEQIIKDEEEKRQLYRDNNKRNNDIFSVSKANGKLNYGVKTTKGQTKHGGKNRDSLNEQSREKTINEEEDYLLTLITLKRISKKDDQ